MLHQIKIKDESLRGDLLNELMLEFKSESVTVRDLIVKRVEHEVEKYNSAPKAYFQGFIEPTEAEKTLNGYKMKEMRRVDPEKQVFTALHAFQQNAFFILIDNVQAESLEQKVMVSEQTNVTFMKLTPLVGG